MPVCRAVSEGDPFTALADEGLLAFDPRAAKWGWELPRIHAKGYTENIADLMAAKLSRLPAAARDALGQLACLGNVAEVAALTWVQGGSEERMHADPWEAVRMGLVFREANVYEFAHDRLKEAAYALIPADERAAAHLRIVPEQPDGYRIEAEARRTGNAIEVKRLPDTGTDTPAALLRYVMHTGQRVIIDDALASSLFPEDAYLVRGVTRSVFCLPLVRQGKLGGLLYLENTGTSHVFTARRSALLERPASQAAISLESTRLYADLQEREAKVRRLVDSNIIGIHIWDFEGNVIEANDAFLRIVGYTAADLRSGQIRWPDLTPPERHERDERARDELKATGSAKPFEKEYFRKDGSRVAVLVGAAAFGDREGQGVAFILDLSDQKRAQQDVRDSERRYRELQNVLAHSNRVATMGQLSASIAHEVKQPITAIAAYASSASRWLAARPPNFDEARLALTRIVADSERVNGIVDRTRAYFKKEPLRTDGLDVNDMIRELIALTRSEASKSGVEVTVELADGLPHVQGDRVQLQQVMLNLMINAIEAMSEMKTGERMLLVRTGRTDENELCVSVQDSGPALAAGSPEGVFEAFFTTKPEGLGMGLPICRSIVQGHGGRLWATPNVPAGVSFHFTLPAQGNASQPVSA
ncbi:GAF domain-containing sensor histidine kinase [Paraburkholderia acidiphila]|uniref:histidine kinase n=1 Tax=Paraburkholderia acidiphila TaxID=2571747 RepID=A0A7Z2JBS0_9BURK|nr:ATP-binding protein [Paraburkholderia acidiphila]QGZ59302.1 PAS domain S-box protein [Paraburkholderia acidiphila]